MFQHRLKHLLNRYYYGLQMNKIRNICSLYIYCKYYPPSFEYFYLYNLRIQMTCEHIQQYGIYFQETLLQEARDIRSLFFGRLSWLDFVLTLNSRHQELIFIRNIKYIKYILTQLFMQQLVILVQVV